MGLDQYAYSEDSNGERRDRLLEKHNRLQGWMENLYTDKGGMEEFNTVDLELTLEDLDVLESTMMNKPYPKQEASSTALTHTKTMKIKMDIKVMMKCL